TAYWHVGRRIVEHEQQGEERAEYGEKLLERLAKDLTGRFGKGFSRQTLQSMRSFYLAYSTLSICQTPSGKSAPLQIRQKASGKSESSMEVLSIKFPLPWSHYVRLLSVKDP